MSYVFEPQGSKLYVERVIEDETVKYGGAEYKDEDFKAPSALKVKVLAVNPESTEYPEAYPYKVGDILMVSQFAPTEVKIVPGETGKYVVPAEDILGIVKSDKVAQ